MTSVEVIPNTTAHSPRPDILKEPLLNLAHRGKNIMSSLLSAEGMRASQDGRFNHFFGRDTFVSASFIDNAHEFSPDLELWSKTKQAVFSFWRFQRADGKIIHEAIRNDEMMKKKRENPMNLGDVEGFYHPVGEYLVNDDSVDATALALIATPQFFTSETDLEFVLPKAKMALHWMMSNMDENGGFLRYEKNKLSNQGWMDSEHGVVADDGKPPDGPIALVEAQTFAWKALRTWSDILAEKDSTLSVELRARADMLKTEFNDSFVFGDEKGTYFAHALDGKDNQIKTPSINPGLGLWANYEGETIFFDKFVPDIVNRLTSSDFFDPEAGISTFEKDQPTFDEEGYHNGECVYWPFATALVAKGMLDLGYKTEAKKVLTANLPTILYFDSFVETFSKNGGAPKLFRDGGENGSCRNQAWTIAQFLWSINYLTSTN